MSEPTFALEPEFDGMHFWWEHDCSFHGKRVRGVLPFGTEKGWTVTQKEPLTVTPSIHCLGCGTHGFITNGEWISV